MVWHVPFSLQVPTFGNTTRTSSPQIVRLGRAAVSGDQLTPVHFGACSWQWNGDGSVQILDVDGLVDGVKYQLTFEAIG
jgi:hypothetical protein